MIACCSRWLGVCAWMFLSTGWLCAQASSDTSPLPASLPPKPIAKVDLDRLEALKLYATGLWERQRQHRLVEALGLFEKARALAPDTPHILRELVKVYLELDRREDAASTCQALLELDPSDPSVWLGYGRVLGLLQRKAEALTALEKGCRCEALREQPKLQVTLLHELAKAHEELGKPKEAAQAFQQLATLLERGPGWLNDPLVSADKLRAESAELHEKSARLFVQAKLLPDALQALHKAQSLDPERRQRLAFSLAQIYEAQGENELALRAVQVYVQTQPIGLEAYELVASLLRKLGRPAEVYHTFQRFVQLDPNHQGLKLLLAREATALNRYAEAELLYTELAKFNPSLEVYQGWVQLYKKRGPGGLEQLLLKLNRLVVEATEKEDKPPSPTAAANARALLGALRDDREAVKTLLPLAVQKLGTGQLAYETRAFLAILASRTNQLDLAESLYRSCLTEARGVGRRDEHEIYSGLLRVLWLGRKYTEIVEVCRQGLEKSKQTNRVLFHTDLARALLQLGKLDEAIEEAKQGVDFSGPAEKLFAKRVFLTVLAEAKRGAEAEAEGQALLQQYTKPSEIREIRYALSGVYSTLKQPAKSAEQLLLILESDPNDATANNDLGYLWAEQNIKLAEAEKMIRKALELEKQQKKKGSGITIEGEQESAAYTDSLGWVLFRQGRLAEAKALLEKASQLPGGDDDPVVWDHLGDVYSRLGSAELAKQAWEKALYYLETGRRRQQDERAKELKQKLSARVKDLP